MTRRQIAACLAIIICAGVAGLLIGLAITREIDRVTEPQRPDTPTLNSVEG